MSSATLEDTSVDLKKSDLINTQGVSYAEFRRTLTPKYARVWLHVFLGYLALAACAAAVALTETRISGYWVPVLAVAGACAIGYGIHFLHLFMHEGAHYNLASNRTWNDRLANVFIGLLVGMHMKPYRPTHFDHHRHLGTPRDTEIAYFDPLNMRFIVESVTGLRILKTLLNRNKTHQMKGIESGSYDGRIAYRALIVTGLLHVAVAGIAFGFGFVALSVAWFFGAFTVYPFLGALRTLLEHRSEHASKKIDYRHHIHGAINRMFGAGPFARTFGNAGFNRHLLHHWDPQVSYTRLRDLERFMVDTPAGKAFIEQHLTTYSRTFARLYNR